MQRLKSIDMLRGLAALAVVFHHAQGRSVIGMIGVDFFFVVSGFVIFHSAQGRTAANFLAARFWRIFPIYWIAMVPWLLHAAFAGTLSATRASETILLAPLWWTTHVPLLFLAWTLAFECLFYTATAISLRLRAAAPMLALFAAALVAWGFGLSPKLMWIGNPMIVEFLMGIAIARAPRDRKVGAALFALGVAWLLLFPTTSYPMEFRDFSAALGRTLLWGLPAACIVYAAVSFEERLTGRWALALSAVGTASYSIYLFHPLVTDLFVGVWWPLEFVTAVAVGIAAWAFIERPLTRIRPRRGRPTVSEPTTTLPASAVSLGEV